MDDFHGTLRRDTGMARHKGLGAPTGRDGGVHATEEPRRVSMFGNLTLNDFSTPELRERWVSADAGVREKAEELNRFHERSMALQRAGDPLRAEIKQLDHKFKEKLGVGVGRSVIDLVARRTLSLGAAIGLFGAVDAFLEAQRKAAELGKAFEETSKARSDEEMAREKLLIMVTEKSNVADILDHRDARAHRDQERRRRFAP